MENNILEISLCSVNSKVKFDACAPDKPNITIDYFPPVGDGEGYTSLELLMISFASCISTALLSLLRTMRKTVTALSAHAKGVQREEHPKSLSAIDLTIILTSPDVEEADVRKALAFSEEKYCPVWAMLKGNVEIRVNFEIKQ